MYLTLRLTLLHLWPQIVKQDDIEIEEKDAQSEQTAAVKARAEPGNTHLSPGHDSVPIVSPETAAADKNNVGHTQRRGRRRQLSPAHNSTGVTLPNEHRKSLLTLRQFRACFGHRQKCFVWRKLNRRLASEPRDKIYLERIR